MKFWKLIAVLMLPTALLGQAYYQNQAFTTAYINGTRVVSVMPGAQIQVCTSATGPCVQVPVFSDAGLSVPIVQPFAADGYGNFGFWVTAGTYAYSILNAQGVQQQRFPFTVGNGSGGGTLSGDTTGPAGGNTVVKVNGAPVPPSVPVVATDAESHIVPAIVQGNGNKVQLATGPVTPNHCPKYDAAGNLVDSGAGCGGGVPSVNALTGALNIVAGPNVTVTPSGSNITIGSTSSGGVAGYFLGSPTVTASGVGLPGQVLTLTSPTTAVFAPPSGGGGSGGGLSGQTATYLPKASTPTGSDGPSIVEDQTTGIVIHGTSPSHGITLPEGAPLAPVAGNAVIATDSTIHRATLSNNGAAPSPVGTLADYAAPPAIGSVAPNTVTGRTLMQRGSQADCVGPGLFGANDCGGTYLLDDGTAATGSGTAVTNWDFNMFAWGPGGKGIAEGRTTAVFADNGVLATPGIKNVYQSATSMFGAGDVLFENKAYICNSGVAYTSDQGCQGEWMDVGQGESRGLGAPGYFIANLATGGVGTQSPTFDGASIHGCTSPLNQTCVPSPVSNLLDMTTPLATGFLNSPSVPFTGVPQPWLNQIPTTGGLPIATAWGYKMGVNLAPNTPWNLPNSQTFTLQAGAGTFAAGDLACVIGSGYPSFEEQSIITAVSGVSPTQAITLPLSRPEVNVSIFKGGCHFISFNADAALGTRTAYPGVSIDGTNLIYAIPGYSQMLTDPTLPIAGAEPETTAGSTDPNSGFVLYCGARVNEVTGFTAHTPSTVELEPNGCTWPAGGVVEDPDFPLQKVDGIEMIANQNNPATSKSYMVAAALSIKGMGATTSSSVLNLNNFFSPNCSAYSSWGCGGKLGPPHMTTISGVFQDNFFMGYGPADSLITILNHLPGQASYKLLADPWENIVISPNNVDFGGSTTVHSAGVITGTIFSAPIHSVTNGGPPSDFGTTACCETKPSINAYAWNNKPAYSLQNAANTASFGMFTVNAADNNPAIGTAPGNALGSLDLANLNISGTCTGCTGSVPDPLTVGTLNAGLVNVTAGAVNLHQVTNTGYVNVNGYDYLGVQQFGFGYSGAGTSGAPFMGGKFFVLGVNAPICILAWSSDPSCGMQMSPTDDSTVWDALMTVPNIKDSALTAGNCVQAGTGGLLTTTAAPCGGSGGVVSSLTTTGTSGAATLAAGVLNIPNYATGGGSAVHGSYSWSVQPANQALHITSGAIYYISATATSAAYQNVVNFANGACTAWPSVTYVDLGTSATSASGTWTTIGTVIPTANGATTGSGTFTFTTGHYIGVTLTKDATTCTAFPTIDATLTY